MSDMIVIDAGSGSVRAGLTTDDAPRVTIPSVYEGNRPFERGIVQNWDTWTGLMRQTFDALGIDPAGKSVLINEPPWNSRIDREQLTRILFTQFKVGGLCIVLDALLALYQSGRTTGIVIMLGHDVSHVVPIYMGHEVTNAMTRLDLAGRDLNEKMRTELAEEGTQVDLDTARAIKENIGYVALDFQQALQSGGQGPATHAGHTAKNARFSAPETLFEPILIGMNANGIHRTTYDALMRCDVGIRKKLCANVVLAGGTAHFPGILDRMKQEISAIPPHMEIVITPPAVEGVWKGADLLGEQPNFSQMFFSRAEYDQYGPSYIHRKCS